MSIVAQNFRGDGEISDIAGWVGTGGYNLVGDGSGMGGMTSGQNGDLVGTYDVPLDPMFVNKKFIVRLSDEESVVCREIIKKLKGSSPRGETLRDRPAST
jgi:hypothetical protein